MAKWLDFQFEGPQVGNQVRALSSTLVEAVRHLQGQAQRVSDWAETLWDGVGDPPPLYVKFFAALFDAGVVTECESCPCCCAGWCVSGRSGEIPNPTTDAENYAIWLDVACEHNPVARRLVEVEAERDALAAEVERLNGLVEGLREAKNVVIESNNYLAAERGRLTELSEAWRTDAHTLGTEVAALRAEVERLKAEAASLDAVVMWSNQSLERAAAVITRVRAQLQDVADNGLHIDLKPSFGDSRYAYRQMTDYLRRIDQGARERAQSLLALLDSPNTEETAECVNCGGPMPGRRPGDVCRDCQGRVPNTEEQTP